MSYNGEVVAQLRDGTEIRRMTDAEVASSGSREPPRYCIVGHSHWNPVSTFAYEADRLERKAKLYREASMVIQLHSRRNARQSESVADVAMVSSAGTAVTREDAVREVLESARSLLGFLIGPGPRGAEICVASLREAFAALDASKRNE